MVDEEHGIKIGERSPNNVISMSSGFTGDISTGARAKKIETRTRFVQEPVPMNVILHVPENIRENFLQNDENN